MMSGRSSTTGRMNGDDAHVVAHQIAFGDLQLRPEHLPQVAHLERLPAGQTQRPGIRSALDLVELIAARPAGRRDAASSTLSLGSGIGLCDSWRLAPSVSSLGVPSPPSHRPASPDKSDAAASPSSVHSVNFTWATSDGFVQCGRSLVRGRALERRRARSRAASTDGTPGRARADRIRCRCGPRT